MAISDIVTVNITRETRTVSQKGFGVMMFIDLFKVFNDRIRFYSDLDSIVADGFPITSHAYLAAQAAFSQNPSPQQIAIGRQQSDDAVVSVVTAKNTTVYSVKINGTTVSFTSSGSATLINVATGLVGAINGASLPVTATDHMDGTFTLAPTVSATPFSLSVDQYQTFALTATESLVAALTAIRAVDDNWYGLATYSKVDSDILALAAYIEATNNEGAKIYGISSSESAIITSGTTDIASQLQALKYSRTFILYNGGANNFPECAWFGGMLPLDPGSGTWKFKTLVGQVTDNLTLSQTNYALTKNANVYLTQGGVDITENGTVCDDEFIDVIVGIDWITSRIEENIFSMLVNAKKVPYTDAGVTLIQNQIIGVLQEAVKNGIIAATPLFTVTVPYVAYVSPTDRANRFLPNVKFTATLAGAIHSVVINGYVSV